MFTNVLIPTDGSEVADRAGELAIDIADRFDADLHILSIARPKTQERSEAAVDRLAEAASDAGIKAKTKVLKSQENAADEILGYVHQNDIDGIVMGTHGRTGLSRFILGSVAMQTLQSASVPVVTVHEDSDISFGLEDILVPTDGSKSAEAAATYAIEVAAETGATIHALHVTDDPDALTEGAQTPAHEIADQAANAGVEDIEVVVRKGRPHLEIAGYISEESCDAVIMGTYGKTGIRRYLIGSTTERTLRFSTVPVIAIRPREVMATVEYLSYEAVQEQGWSHDDEDLFAKAEAAGLERADFGAIEIEEGEYILDAAEGAGYDWPFYCRAGGCVNCAAILYDGDVEMERCNSLSEEEQEEENLFLTCVATPTSDTVKVVYKAKQMDRLQSRVI